MEKKLSIVSLIASATEMVCLLGLKDSLVGVSHECDFPQNVVKKLPRLSKPKILTDAKSFQIDREVRNYVRQGLSIYEIDVDQLLALKPDLIITQDHCEVCAVSLKDVKNALCQLSGRSIPICTLRPKNLADIFSDILRIGQMAGIENRARSAITDLMSRLENIRIKTQSLKRRPTVLGIEWLEPPMLAGLWIPELIEIAGGVPLGPAAEEPFRTVNWEQIRSYDADVVSIFPCGYTVFRTEMEIQETGVGKNLKFLRATKEGHCYICDGNALFDRPGPRIVDSVELLAFLLHPEQFPEYRKKIDKEMCLQF